MKYAIIIPDGCADEPQASLGGLTPLQAARTPHMDSIAAAGVVGRSNKAGLGLWNHFAAATVLECALFVGAAGIFWQWWRAEQNLYVANIRSGYESLHAGDLARTREFLRGIESSWVQRSMRGWDWRHLAGRVSGDLKAILSRHNSFVWGVATSPDGRWLASLDGDGRVQLWDWPATQLLNTWSAHATVTNVAPDQRMHDLLFSPDNKMLITVGADHWLRFWETPTGRKLFEFEIGRAHV